MEGQKREILVILLIFCILKLLSLIIWKYIIKSGNPQYFLSLASLFTIELTIKYDHIFTLTIDLNFSTYGLYIVFNPTALSLAKTPVSCGQSECNKVKRDIVMVNLFKYLRPVLAILSPQNFSLLRGCDSHLWQKKTFERDKNQTTFQKKKWLSLNRD